MLPPCQRWEVGDDGCGQQQSLLAAARRNAGKAGALRAGVGATLPHLHLHLPVPERSAAALHLTPHPRSHLPSLPPPVGAGAREAPTHPSTRACPRPRAGLRLGLQMGRRRVRVRVRGRVGGGSQLEVATREGRGGAVAHREPLQPPAASSCLAQRAAGSYVLAEPDQAGTDTALKLIARVTTRACPSSEAREAGADSMRSCGWRMSRSEQHQERRAARAAGNGREVAVAGL